MSAVDLTLILTIFVLAVAILTAWLARPRRPCFRFDHMMIRPATVNGRWNENEPWSVDLVFVNDGPGVAPGANAYATGALQNWHEPEIQYPHDGSPTVAIGGQLSVSGAFKSIPMPEGFRHRRYFKGDDVFFDLQGLSVRIEWGRRVWWLCGRRRKQRFNDLHRQQQAASPQFVKLD